MAEMAPPLPSSGPGPQPDQTLPAWEDLPKAALLCILQHVPLRQRLNCCALVCSVWAAVALTAPADVSVSLYGTTCAEQLQDWLSKHAGVVVAFTVWFDNYFRDDWSWSPMQLPVSKFTQLGSLTLNSSVKVQLPGEGGTTHSSTAALLPQLQVFRLDGCHLSERLVSQLLSTRTLSYLTWGSVQLHSDDWTEQLTQAQVCSVLWQRLQALPNLAVLQLEVNNLTAADMAPLSTLQHLKSLTLRRPSYKPAQHELDHRGMLAALQHLTQLQHLWLMDCQLDRFQPQEGDGFQCFSALTASTQLDGLFIVESAGMPVPKAAFDHMFCPGRVLLNLQGMLLKGSTGPVWGAGLGSFNMRTMRCVEPAQVARIAAGCPALSYLDLQEVTPEDFDASCLQQLPPAVTQVEGLSWTRPAAAGP